MANGTPRKRIRPEDLAGKVTDAHAHVGVSIGAYARLEFPYCQSLEGLRYKQAANLVDYGVVFPFSGDLHFDLPTLAREGTMVPAQAAISAVPYQIENHLLLTEVYDFLPELQSRFLPFVCADPRETPPARSRP